MPHWHLTRLRPLLRDNAPWFPLGTPGSTDVQTGVRFIGDCRIPALVYQPPTCSYIAFSCTSNLIDPRAASIHISFITLLPCSHVFNIRFNSSPLAFLLKI
ncbi:unnamed protein product [Pleuronectes platessa]|uniref:Uncharacterized protein n=1 Tax=Pleuronectes platessa TaxID=8262 RepID=A0A9N7VEZ4_PLEPL|nr:unnamed protein product [Pleuronectes platessa]